MKISQRDKSIISFSSGGVITAVFSLLFFNSFIESPTSAAAIAIYVISFIFGIFGAFSGLAVSRKGNLPFKKNTHFYSVFAFIMALAAVAVGYIVLGVYPFGEKTVLVIDMYHQYVVFFMDLKNKLLSGEGILYSLHLGLGGSYLPLFAYYLASPFNIIAMLFPLDYMSEGIALVEFLKIASASFTFSLFIKGVFKRNDFSVTAISVMYALSSYIMAYSWNVMWLDCIIFLPLAALGMHKLIYNGDYRLYCISLGMCLLCNFYIGFMVCIALVLYFISVVFADTRIGFKTIAKGFLKFIFYIPLILLNLIYRFIFKVSDQKILPEKNVFTSYLGRFTLGSLIGGGISAVLVIPTYLALQLTSSANDVFPEALDTNFNILDLLSQQFFSVPLGIDFGDKPNIYCGVIIILLIFLYIYSKKVPLRTKIAELSFVLIMGVSCILNYTDWIWHGLHYPNGLPYRFAFVYIFAVLIVGYKGFINSGKKQVKPIAAGLLFAVSLLAFLEANDYFSDKVRIVYGSIAFLLIYSFILLLYTKEKLPKKSAAAFVSVVLCIELAANGILSVNNMDERFYYSSRDGFYQNYEAVSKAADELERKEDTFFRMEHLPSNTCNDNSLYGYNGLTVFASSNPQYIVTLLDRLGYANNGVNSHMYRTFSPASDSLFGLKYLITESNIGNHPQLTKFGTIDGDNGTLNVYKNEFALPLGYCADSRVYSWVWDHMEFDGINNPFETLNEFFELATGVSDVYKILDLEADEGSNFILESSDADYIAGYPEDYSYNGSVTMSCELEEDGQVFAFGDVEYMRALSAYYVSESGSSSIDINNSEPYIADLGVRYAGDTVGLSVEVNSNTKGTVTCAMLNQENFKKAMAKLASSPFKEETVSDTFIKGTVSNSDSKALILSVPYDKGWTAKIDGKKAEIIPLGNALISITVPSGEHTVEFSFRTRGIIIGLTISILSVILFILVCTREKIILFVYSKMSIKNKNKFLKNSGFNVKDSTSDDSDDFFVTKLSENDKK